MELQPGQTIMNGKYRIERLLGRGAFGEVYLATHVLLKAPVAIKVLRSNAPGIGNAQLKLYRERFVQEAKLGKGLNHPCVVRVDDFVVEKGVLYLVMEACTGGSLAERLARARTSGQPVPIAEAVQIALEVAQGLAALHAHAIVHRDLKPSNILFDARGHAKVADLGLAQTLHGLSDRTVLASQASRHPGTPGYMSPEQEQTIAYLKPASDVYVMGLLLFEVLTGRPYSNLRPGTRAKSLRADVPTWLDDLIARMLAKAPEDRPWDGAATVQALEEGKQRIEADHRMYNAAADFGFAPSVPAHWGQTPEMPRPRPVPAVFHSPVPLRATPMEPDLLAGEKAPRTGPSVSSSGGSWLLLIGVVVVIVIAVLSSGQPPDNALEPTPTPTPEPAAGTARVRAQDGAVGVYVPAGEFTMGPASGDSEANEIEKPQHQVTLAGYWIDRTEVTNGQYRKFVEAGGYGKREYWTDAGWQWKEQNRIAEPGCWGDGNFNQAEQPVVCVSWYEAMAYAQWVGGRLPSEAEWEHAARGTDGRKYPWGNQAPDCSRLNYWGNEGGCVGRTSPAGTYPRGASPYDGVLDMSGNAWEWTSSLWGTDENKPQFDYPYKADDGREDPRPTDALRILRGGSWKVDAGGVRAALRGRFAPGERNKFIGFRVLSTNL